MHKRLQLRKSFLDLAIRSFPWGFQRTAPKSEDFDAQSVFKTDFLIKGIRVCRERSDLFSGGGRTIEESGKSEIFWAKSRRSH
ncbi:hypothetical protein AAC387_Pa02g4687 [Persea americana]